MRLKVNAIPNDQNVAIYFLHEIPFKLWWGRQHSKTTYTTTESWFACKKIITTNATIHATSHRKLCDEYKSFHLSLSSATFVFQYITPLWVIRCQTCMEGSIVCYERILKSWKEAKWIHCGCDVLSFVSLIRMHSISFPIWKVINWHFWKHREWFMESVQQTFTSYLESNNFEIATTFDGVTINFVLTRRNLSFAFDFIELCLILNWLIFTQFWNSFQKNIRKNVRKVILVRFHILSTA